MIIQPDGSADQWKIKEIKKVRIGKMGLCCEGFALFCFYIEEPAVPPDRFLYTCVIILCNLCQILRAIAFQIVISYYARNNPKNAIPVLMKIIITETKTVCLNTPHKRCNADSQADDVDKRI